MANNSTQDMWNSHCGSFSRSRVCVLYRPNKSVNKCNKCWTIREYFYSIYASEVAGATELDPYKPVNRPTDSLLNLVWATTYEWSYSQMCVCLFVQKCHSYDLLNESQEIPGIEEKIISTNTSSVCIVCIKHQLTSFFLLSDRLNEWESNGGRKRDGDHSVPCMKWHVCKWPINALGHFIHEKIESKLTQIHTHRHDHTKKNTSRCENKTNSKSERNQNRN